MKNDDLHHKAMELADEADLAKRLGNIEESKTLYQEALEYELVAAGKFRDRLDVEPTRSVLYRSAATLAFECCNFSLSIRLASKGLAGNPPAEIRDELEDILESATDAEKSANPIFVGPADAEGAGTSKSSDGKRE
ncbi:MAG: hypothetical protein NUW37_08475 [Planctomycetes bacterium]|nr:hypothetical protein [Planctomycetota bacterium]